MRITRGIFTTLWNFQRYSNSKTPIWRKRSRASPSPSSAARARPSSIRRGNVTSTSVRASPSTSSGANDEKWKAAVIDQLSRIQHVSNYYYSEPQLDLAELLCFRTGAKRVFFANSGAEANECALKAARKYSFEKYGEGRKKIISLNGSFHGRTLFTLTATGQEAFHRFFGPFVPEVVSVDANMQAVEKESENACAVIIECVQGESGVEALDKGFVRALRAFCDEHDILLICDEVQSGNGRTGKFCAYEPLRHHAPTS